MQERQERDYWAAQWAHFQESQGASHRPSRSTVSTRGELDVPEGARWLPAHEDILNYASPHAREHWMPSTQGIPTQRGMPHHAATHLDSRESFRAVRSGLLNPGREQGTLPRQERYLPSEERFAKRGGEHSLMSPSYRNTKVEPSEGISLRLRDLMAVNKCTKYELESAMKYYLRLLGREVDSSTTFWSLASHFRKLMSHNPSELPMGLLNPLFADRKIYENAIWIFYLLEDPEQMEKVTRATDARDASIRASKSEYPVLPLRQGITQSRLDSPAVSRVYKASSFHTEHEDHPSNVEDQVHNTSQLRDQSVISARARQVNTADSKDNTIPYEQRDRPRRFLEKDLHLLIIPEIKDKVHIVYDRNNKWEFIPITRETRVTRSSFVSTELDRRLALQLSIDEILAKEQLVRKEILDVKAYKEKIRMDPGGSFIVRALVAVEESPVAFKHENPIRNAGTILPETGGIKREESRVLQESSQEKGLKRGMLRGEGKSIDTRAPVASAEGLNKEELGQKVQRNPHNALEALMDGKGRAFSLPSNVHEGYKGGYEVYPNPKELPALGTKDFIPLRNIPEVRGISNSFHKRAEGYEKTGIQKKPVLTSREGVTRAETGLIMPAPRPVAIVTPPSIRIHEPPTAVVSWSTVPVYPPQVPAVVPPPVVTGNIGVPGSQHQPPSRDHPRLFHPQNGIDFELPRARDHYTRDKSLPRVSMEQEGLGDSREVGKIPPLDRIEESPEDNRFPRVGVGGKDSRETRVNPGSGGTRGPGGPPSEPSDWGANSSAYWHESKGWLAVRGPRGQRGETGPPGRDASQLPELDQRKDRFNKESKLDIKMPESFAGLDRSKWEPFLSQIQRVLTAKPTIYEEDRDKIGLAASYLTEAAGAHYDNLVNRAESGEEVLSLVHWTEFVREFTSKFGVFDVTRDAQSNFSWTIQQPHESFASFIVRFQQYAFKTGFNDEALVFKLRESVHANLDILVASQQNQPRSYDEWVNRFQELDSSVQATREAHSQAKYRSTENPILRSTQTRNLNNRLDPWMDDEQEDTRGVQHINLVDLTEGEIENYNERNWDMEDSDEEIPFGGEWITPEHNAKCKQDERWDVLGDEQDNLVDQIEGRMTNLDEEITEMGDSDEEIPFAGEWITPEHNAKCKKDERGNVIEVEQDNLVYPIEGRIANNDEEMAELGRYDEDIRLEEELIDPEDEAACTRTDLTSKNNWEWEKRLSREQYEF